MFGSPKKGRQTARTFVAAGVADLGMASAGAKRIPFCSASRRLNKLYGILLSLHGIDGTRAAGHSLTARAPSLTRLNSFVPRLAFGVGQVLYQHHSYCRYKTTYNAKAEGIGILPIVPQLPCYVTYIESQSYVSMYSLARAVPGFVDTNRTMTRVVTTGSHHGSYGVMTKVVTTVSHYNAKGVMTNRSDNTQGGS